MDAADAFDGASHDHAGIGTGTTHDALEQWQERGASGAGGPVREHWLVADCVVVGNPRHYIAALITLDGAAFARSKQRQGKPPRRPSATCATTRTCSPWPQKPWTGRTRRCPGLRALSGSASWTLSGACGVIR
jgi:hypothetical protein